MLTCSAAAAEDAARILRSSAGMMVRQPLARAGHELAFCDYHAIAAPYLRAVSLPAHGWGRGAAGRPATKEAFLLALEAYAEAAREHERREARTAPLKPAVAAAMAAFGTDFAYAAAMAAAASQLLARRGTSPSRPRRAQLAAA